jgi:outer membrane protein OmpA-like peptidoglycan-associated protein
MRGSTKFFCSFSLLLLSTSIYADSDDGKDCEGCSDTGVSARYPGAVLFGADQKAFEEAIVATGPVLKNDVGDNVAPKTVTLTGKRTRAFYIGPAQRSGLEVFANYRQALEKAGMSVVWTCSNDEQCGPEFLNEATRVMHLSLTGTGEADEGFQLAETPRYLLVKQDRPQGNLHVAVIVADIPHSQRAGIFVVQLEDKAMDNGMAPPKQNEVTVESKVDIAKPAVAVAPAVVDAKPMVVESVPVAVANSPAAVEGKPVDSVTLNNDLASTGKVNVYGIHFDFDRADVKPESKAQLDEIAKLLSANPTLKLRVTGHTDSTGSASHNLELSGRRADAIVAALKANYAIAATRLSASGLGASLPVASNDTDQGRALNRRVELIKQ